MNLAPLAPLFERPGPWASVYADTGFADERTVDRRPLQARQAARELAEQGADDATCHAVQEALGEAAYGSGHPGMAVFAAHGEVVLDPPLSLRPPQGVSSTWASLPHMAPLLDYAPDEPLCLVAYIDRIGADFEVRTATRRSPAGGVDGWDWPVHRTSNADWSERHFQLSVENTWEENALTVAQALQDCVEQTGAGLVILAGDERERRSVHEKLPQHLRAQVIETEHGGRAQGSASRLLDEHVDAARHAFTERHVQEELSRFLAARTPTSGHIDATEGVPALVDAAREHRIAELFLSPEGAETRRQVWAGPDPDQIAVRRTQVQYLGATDPFPARADDALLRSAAMAGADAVLVHPEPGTPAPLGGLGALLRWPNQGEQPPHEPGFG
ncbi:hypothetical protein HUT18_16015 [Streptomyces sp. NA04227]|uniref:baeRF2 domain-containing protein n=1 Tax=Streptomyces sp. NA04227 TaxID=2742136 RepID=UPI001590009E|nr:Vms1/Ankzf1 family peptidyl-tRNA hydrolase [Streptomyces sp. NA04227]QKW07660.1 hypothetical protein HUT18_16015 [Streptomyces sp. NA04227]